MTSLLQAALISSPCWRCKHSISTTARTTSMSITAMSPVQNQRRGGWVLTVTGKAVGFGRSSSSTIRCMANPRRVKMVAKQIMRELSDMLLTDTVLQYAILPEASLGADLYLSSLATITDVQVSPDLQVPSVPPQLNLSLFHHLEPLRIFVHFKKLFYDKFRVGESF